MKRAIFSLNQVRRSLQRYWGVTVLNVLGLAIGFAVALIISLYIRDELTYDRFMPGADHVYLLESSYGAPGQPLVSSDASPAGMAHWLRSDAPGVESVARLNNVEMPLRSSRYKTLEHFYWADANIFNLLRLRAVHGDLQTALNEPGSIVLSQSKARLYFGRDDVVGQSLTLDDNTSLHVTAVIADLPPNTNLDRDIFVSGKSSYSMLSALDYYPDWQWDSCYTFVRLKPDRHLLSTEIERVAAHHWRGPYSLPVAFQLVTLPNLHFLPEADAQMKPRGHADSVVAMAAVSVLVLLLAAGNFAGLMAAQAVERHSEMAIRSALGARPQDLLIQMLTEAALVTLLALILSLAFVERLLPFVNRLLHLQLSLWSSPTFLAIIMFVEMAVGIASVLYPALRLSRQLPARDIRSGPPNLGSSYLGRIGWITIQFALLVTLLISAQTMQRQWSFAMTKALNFNDHQVLLIKVSSGHGQEPGFKTRLLSLAGVQGAAESRYIPVYMNLRPAWFTNKSGTLIQFTRQSVDPDFFSFYDVPRIAGKNFASAYAADVHPREVIINTPALHTFGYDKPQDAIGKTLTYRADGEQVTSSIIGVVEAMRTGTVREPISPMVFDSQSTFYTILSVRIAETGQAGTLAAIKRIWRQIYPKAGPMQSQFLSQYLADQYQDMEQQWHVFALLSLVGICLTTLGLTGLSIYLARARLREIAIRSALGARPWDIYRLRIAPFVKPILIGNLAAGLMSWLLMSWWLSSFKAHIAISPISFFLGSAITLLVALFTLSLHGLLTLPRSNRPLHED